jgi:hypothetical protein
MTRDNLVRLSLKTWEETSRSLAYARSQGREGTLVRDLVPELLSIFRHTVIPFDFSLPRASPSGTVNLHEEGWLGADGKFYESADDAARSLAEKFQWPLPTRKSSSQAPRALRAFLCHAREDKPAIRQIYARLKEVGVSVWLDEEDLIGGTEWKDEIRKAISRTDAFIIFLSKEAITKTGYVHSELRQAMEVADMQPEGRIFIIPVRLDPSDPPTRLKDLQWIDYFEPHGHSQLLSALSYLSAWLNQNGTIVHQMSQPTMQKS